MEPLVIIAGATALNLAAVALIDVLSLAKPWPRKLGWCVVILGLPLIGAFLYYLPPARRADRGPSRRAGAERRTAARTTLPIDRPSG